MCEYSRKKYIFHKKHRRWFEKGKDFFHNI